jgi:acyl-CoA synthetase (AMP-forming)/AMP-acid ligase II
MTEAFGQTEAPAMITAKAPWDYIDSDGNINEKRLASVGRPCVLNKVAIMADDGALLPRGQPGEIVVRGRLVNPGYYKDPEATAQVRHFGWHHTGDIGVMDEDGYITIIDRKKDMIISGGFNVYPNEIEQVLAAHPAIQECAVIGVPDNKWGEAVKAIVSLRPGCTATAAELIALVRKRLGAVKSPKSIDFITDMPRSPAGKVLKTELRKPYWKKQSRAVN